ncbi:MAG: potassium channel family protein [Eubacterium sp.]
MKTVLIIGAGKFGSHLAINLCDMGNEVMLVDKSERLIDEFSHQVTTAEIGDYTMKSNLESLGVEDYDYIFVCVGDFQDSLVIVDYLKELGAECIIAKASSEIHEKFLLKNGADNVIYPERDTAYDTAVAYSNRRIYDFVKLSDDTGIYEIEVPDAWCGQSLLTLNIRKIHNITVIASKDSNQKVSAINSADYIFNKADHIIVMGNKKDIRKITKD